MEALHLANSILPSLCFVMLVEAGKSIEFLLKQVSFEKDKTVIQNIGICKFATIKSWKNLRECFKMASVSRPRDTRMNLFWISKLPQVSRMLKKTYTCGYPFKVLGSIKLIYLLMKSMLNMFT